MRVILDGSIKEPREWGLTHLVDYGLAQAVVFLVRSDSGGRTAAGTGTATGPSFDVGMWIGTGPLKPEHELTENAMDETWEEEEEEMEEEESIMETQSMKTQVLEAYASLFFSRPFTLSQANRWTVAEESLMQTGGLWPRNLVARRLQARRSP